MGWKVFSNKQGSGYIYESEQEMHMQINVVSVTINTKKINPGDMTTLDGHFCRELRYLGMKDNKEMIFEIGTTKDLFTKKYYYQSVLWVSENRIFEMFSWDAGRDFYYINGKWK